MNPKQDEFIGKKIIIIDAMNASLRGMKGTIIDETQQTFVVQTARGQKRILKKGATFSIAMNGNTVLLAGKELVKSPEERIRNP